MFVLDAESGEHAEQEPKMRRTAIDDAHQQIDASHPEKRLKRIHGKEIAIDQKHDREKRSRTTERDSPTTTAQLARDRAGDCDRSCARQGWKQTDRKKRIAEQHSAQPNKQGRQWRKIDVTEVEMLAASHVIELVAKVAIAAVREQVDEERSCAKPDDQELLARQPLGCWFDSRDWHAAILRANAPRIANSI